jgi:hypothetical protein
MIMNAFTLIHVALSLIGIGGLAVVRELLVSNAPYRGSTLFLASTAATGATGFFFPFHGRPSRGVSMNSYFPDLLFDQPGLPCHFSDPFLIHACSDETQSAPMPGSGRADRRSRLLVPSPLHTVRTGTQVQSRLPRPASSIDLLKGSN